jgi:hypothetical protein
MSRLSGECERAEPTGLSVLFSFSPFGLDADGSGIDLAGCNFRLPLG